MLIAVSVMQINTAVTYGQSKESADLKSFPKGSTPQEVGKRIAEHYIAGPHTNFNRPTPPKVITYPETCTWYGALTFAKATKDQALVNQLKQRFEPLFGLW